LDEELRRWRDAKTADARARFRSDGFTPPESTFVKSLLNRVISLNNYFSCRKYAII